MRLECLEHLVRHRGLAIQICITARAWRTCRDACQNSFERKRSWHSRCMRNPQFYVSGKRHIHCNYNIWLVSTMPVACSRRCHPLAVTLLSESDLVNSLAPSQSIWNSLAIYIFTYIYIYIYMGISIIKTVVWPPCLYNGNCYTEKTSID